MACDRAEEVKDEGDTRHAGGCQKRRADWVLEQIATSEVVVCLFIYVYLFVLTARYGATVKDNTPRTSL